jgi:hypothetical protein
MHNAIEQGRDDGHISQELALVVCPSVGGDDDRGFLVPAHQHIGKLIAGVQRQAPQEEIIDQQQIGSVRTFTSCPG